MRPTNRLAAAAVALAFAFGCALAGAAYAQKKTTKPTSEDKKENKEELGLKGKKVAKADIDAKSGSKLKGKATFTQNDKGAIVVRIEVADAPPGEHAVHIHDKGDCSSPDGKSAGDHWNPTHMEHGKWGAPGDHYHLGDIGNLNVDANGKGTLTLETTKWTAGSGAVNDVIGHAIVVHGGVDDFKTQPSGNAGPRIGCGVIGK
ncbi:MAG TPA: superoxide dismutase family protein [Polyangia bacterium]|jgi:Cu-Zn family superoxide dismutase|nr:superoxide dismutase family protein [Polyangia bacterium]